VQDEVIRRVKIRFDEIKDQRAQASQATLAIAVDLIDQSRGRVEAVPSDLWAQLTVEDRRVLYSYAGMIAKGVEPPTDWQLYTDLKVMAGDRSQHEKFLQTNLHQYRDRLSNSEYKDILEDQQ